MPSLASMLITYRFVPSIQMATIESGWCPVVTTYINDTPCAREEYIRLIFDSPSEAQSAAEKLAESALKIVQASNENALRHIKDIQK